MRNMRVCIFLFTAVQLPCVQLAVCCPTPGKCVIPPNSEGAPAVRLTSCPHGYRWWYL